MPVAEAQRRISAREFAEWMAFDQLYPIGRERDDWRAAALLTMLANIHRGKGKPPFKLKQFWPQWDRTEPDPEELEQKAKAAFASLGAALGAEEQPDDHGRVTHPVVTTTPEETQHGGSGNARINPRRV